MRIVGFIRKFASVKKHLFRMKKLLNILYSTRLTAILFILFAAAMAVATFIENDYGTQTSKALVYNSWWFEGIMIFFLISFFCVYLI